MTARPARSRTTALLPAAAALVLAVPSSPVATAQSADPPVAALHLVRQPLWHDPDARLGMALQIENPGPADLPGFYLQVEAHLRAGSRSVLDQALEGSPGLAASSFLVDDYVATPLAPGASATIAVDEPVTDLATFGPDAEGGVYPLTISVFDPDFVPLASTTTPLIFYPERPERPLGLVLVIPLVDLPARGPGAVFRASEDDEPSLEEAVAEGGWLERWVESLDRAVTRGLRPAIVPVPRLVDELADMSDGYTSAGGTGLERVSPDAAPAQAARRMLQRIGDLLDRPEVQPVLAPYALPDLPVAAGRPPTYGIAAQIAAGERAVEAGLGRTIPRGWVFAPGGRLDPASLDQLRLADAGAATFLSEDVLQDEVDETGIPAGCPLGSPTYACPVRIASAHGQVDGFVTDDGLQGRLTELAEGGGVIARQRFLAETAMIHAELPGTERIVAAIVPSGWRIPPAVGSSLAGALASAPWLRTGRPDESLALSGIAPGSRRLERDLPDPSGAPDGEYYDAIDEAAAVVEAFENIQPPAPLVRRLRDNLLVAESRLWWQPPGRPELGIGFARGTTATVSAELDKISVAVPDRVTLTSARGDIEIFLFNDAGYPVRVALRLGSPGLAFDRSVRLVTVEPPGERITVGVRAKTSGIFPLSLRLTTPGPGSRLIAQPEPISIRSTTFNRIALGITLGAAAFLVLFYAARVWRRRIRPPAEPAAT